MSNNLSEVINDLTVVHNLDAEQLLTDMLIREVHEDIDRTTISLIRYTNLDEVPTEETTMVGRSHLWISEEAMEDIRAWGGMTTEPEHEYGHIYGLMTSAPIYGYDSRTKVNWKKEGF